MTDDGDWPDRVLDFWLGLSKDRWFAKDDSLDNRIRQNYHSLWSEMRELPAEAFLGDARTALAAIILFDQFPRNMFRGHADQFATDPLALAIAEGAVDRGYDSTVDSGQRLFFYLPFEHSEALADQDRSVLLFTALGDPEYLAYAKKHREIIERFGRFPHRNAVLGRTPRSAEIAAGDSDPF